MKDQSNLRFWRGITATLGASVVSIAIGALGLRMGYWPGPGYGDEFGEVIAYVATLLIPSAIYILNFFRTRSFCHKNPGTLKKGSLVFPIAANAILLAIVYGAIIFSSSVLFFSSNFMDFWWFFTTALVLTSGATLFSHGFCGYLG